jgi:hypothetical protein
VGNCHPLATPLVRNKLFIQIMKKCTEIQYWKTKDNIQIISSKSERCFLRSWYWCFSIAS